ncbi:hypothetical protein [Phormidium tenue]|uniref:Uncharacterized protein n=1 Tax=Phormidium tenue NIES-30 TaxID=549789 RepID=A0A1U7J9C1_9CYAN|nr:hypothetical protein [Phormidium tenue]MBD2230846.1 hypothetical protein [Phormidium tenue FACHB-1052]OKH50107.1 hypothetical protein NIES30_05245 [Phormidium tenue NIES-30]
MTWNTNFGKRVLEGAEAKFYLHILQAAVEFSQEAVEFDNVEVITGDRIFDSARFEQRVVLWHRCLEALLKPEVPVPPLTNVLEAAAYFPFAWLTQRVEDEIAFADCIEEDDDPFYWRRLIWETLNALGMLKVLEAEFEEEEDILPIEVDCEDSLEWENCIDELADRIFWDRDWQVTYNHPQLLDGIEEEFANQTGISEDYVQNRLPKVTQAEADAALQKILDWQN